MKSTNYALRCGFPIGSRIIKKTGVAAQASPTRWFVGLVALFVGMSGVTFATEPTSPINIITPEDSAKLGKFTTDSVQVVINQSEITGFKPLLILYKDGKRLKQMGVDLRPEAIENPDKESKDKLGLATIEAVPEKFWRDVEPGVYAHKVRIEANIRGESGSLIEEEWVRWRTDGNRLELLDIQQYSELVEKRQKATDEQGKPIELLIGRDIKTESVGKPVIEKRGTQVGSEGVLLERPVSLNKQEIELSQDEKDED